MTGIVRHQRSAPLHIRPELMTAQPGLTPPAVAEKTQANSACVLGLSLVLTAVQGAATQGVHEWGPQGTLSGTRTGCGTQVNSQTKNSISEKDYEKVYICLSYSSFSGLHSAGGRLPARGTQPRPRGAGR